MFSNLLEEDDDIAYLSQSRILNKEDGFSNALFASKLLEIIQSRKVEGHNENFPRGVPENRKDPFLLEEAIDWISQQVEAVPQPFISYFHMIPPHHPYHTRKEFYNVFREDGYRPVRKPEHPLTSGHSDETLERWRRYYDEYILYADAEFGRLIEFLDSTGLRKNTWVVFTSDHGEMFERGIWEHTVPALYDPVIRIPLLISAPGQSERVDITAPTSSVDVIPTLLQANGKDIPDWLEGIPLPPYGPDLPAKRAIFAIDAKKNDKEGPITKGTSMIVEWPYKLMLYAQNKKMPGREYFELFNLAEDSEELKNLYYPEHPAAAELHKKLNMRLGL